MIPLTVVQRAVSRVNLNSICYVIIANAFWQVKMQRKPLTSAQIRAGRSLIRWRADDLAAASALSVATVRRAELKETDTSLTSANDLAIRRALETAGIEFIDENGGVPGCGYRDESRKRGKDRKPA